MPTPRRVLAALLLAGLASGTPVDANPCDALGDSPGARQACEVLRQLTQVGTRVNPGLFPSPMGAGPRVDRLQLLTILRQTWDYMASLGNAPGTVDVDRGFLEALLSSVDADASWTVRNEVAVIQRALRDANGTPRVDVDLWSVVALETLRGLDAAAPEPAAPAALPEVVLHDVPANHWARDAVVETLRLGIWDGIVEGAGAP